MKRIGWILMLALAACVDSGCPKGSEEVAGKCMQVSDVDGGARGDAGDEPDATSQESDASTSTADAAMAGDAEDVGDATDEPLTGCAAVTCAEHAHCEEGDASAPSCVCDEGYDGDGVECEVNPCAEGVSPCDAETTTCEVADGKAVCACLEGRARCDEDEHACTTDLASDAANCGACGMACAGNLQCAEGLCEQAATVLTLGQINTCALTPEGEVRCWGDDEYEQLQRADSSSRFYEAAPAVVGKARLLSMGVRTTCALTLSEELVCWGHNGVNWLGEGPVSGLFELGTELSVVDQISVGVGSACLVVADEVQCWGSTQAFSSSSEILPFDEIRSFVLPDDVLQVSVGRSTCAVTKDARVSCWGEGVASPTLVRGSAGPLEDVRSVSVSPGRVAVCAVIGDGRVMCWGHNRLGMLGDPAAPLDELSEEPVVVSDEESNSLTGFVQVGVGDEHACGRREDGVVLCWGKTGALGNGGTGSGAQRFATEVRELDDAIDLAVGWDHACVRKRTGQVQCWGDNGEGQLGTNPIGGPGVASSPVPVDVIGLP
jgi:hypothetical protein